MGSSCNWDVLLPAPGQQTTWRGVVAKKIPLLTYGYRENESTAIAIACLYVYYVHPLVIRPTIVESRGDRRLQPVGVNRFLADGGVPKTASDS